MEAWLIEPSFLHPGYPVIDSSGLCLERQSLILCSLWRWLFEIYLDLSNVFSWSIPFYLLAVCHYDSYSVRLPHFTLFHTDSTGEYISVAHHHYFAYHNTIVHFLHPDAHAQNSAAECKHHQFLRLPMLFWSLLILLLTFQHMLSLRLSFSLIDNFCSSGMHSLWASLPHASFLWLSSLFWVCRLRPFTSWVHQTDSPVCWL